MSDFLSESACRGVRPKKIELNSKKVREDLISKMMSQRNVLRFIEAPDGYGKSTLAAQYAELVFSFEDVFWIDCNSPCFIRDLDSSDIVTNFIQICANPNLIVFDNFKDLEEGRNLKFSNLIDSLIEYNCEVIVITTPFNDSILKKQNDCLMLTSDELLWNTEVLSPSLINKSIHFRIPVVADDSKNGLFQLLKNAVDENFNNAITFCLFYIYVFSSGDLSNLKSIINKTDYNLLLDFNEKYHYFGIDQENGIFSVPEMPIKQFFQLFLKKLPIFISYIGATSKQDYFEKIIGFLESEKKLKRILEISLCTLNNQIKIPTLSKYNLASIKYNLFGYSIELYESIRLINKNTGLLTTYYSLQMAIAGHIDKAIRASYSVLDNSYSTIENKLLSCLVFMRYGSYNEKTQAIKLIRCLFNDFKINSCIKDKNIQVSANKNSWMIKRMVQTYFSIFTDNFNPFEEWMNNYSDTIKDEDIVCAELIINSWKQIDDDLFLSESYNKFINTISRYFSVNQNIELDFYKFSLINSYLKFVKLHKNIENINKWNINDNLMVNYKNYKKKYLHQKNYVKNHFIVDNKEYKDETISTNKKLTSFNSFYISKKHNFPILNINVFGGLSAFLGDNEILTTNFGRQKIKLICCILVLANGNEIGKNKLAKRVWPDANDEALRINVNSHWSELRKIFTLPDGQCPYLIRNQNSYKFNKHLITSDLDMHEKICNELTLGRIDAQSWWGLIEENDNIISGDLLPSENESLFIINKREEYKQQMVDSLIAASQRLLNSGQIAQALWFAKKALSRDSNREDVYLTLMKIQIQAGQRTPAIDTYFACKKFLEKDLGLEPSREIDSLYRSVIKSS